MRRWIVEKKRSTKEITHVFNVAEAVLQDVFGRIEGNPNVDDVAVVEKLILLALEHLLKTGTSPRPPKVDSEEEHMEVACRSCLVAAGTSYTPLRVTSRAYFPFLFFSPRSPFEQRRRISPRLRAHHSDVFVLRSLWTIHALYDSHKVAGPSM